MLARGAFIVHTTVVSTHSSFQSNCIQNNPTHNLFCGDCAEFFVFACLVTLVWPPGLVRSLCMQGVWNSHLGRPATRACRYGAMDARSGLDCVSRSRDGC